VKISILSDIHGNADALRHALGKADDIGMDRLFVLGDLVGYYYAPAEVLDLLKDRQASIIRGNHERLLADSLSSTAAADDYRKKYGDGLDVARSTLSRGQIEWLLSLPDRLSVSQDGLMFELCHGSPRSPDEYIYPEADRESLDACRIPGRDFVLMGHTHFPFLNTDKKCLLLNPGSVGQPRDHGGAASWCWIDTASRTVCFERTPFDFRSVSAEARARNPELRYLADLLEQGAVYDPSSTILSF
jgi:putative phosphoesterase